MTRVRRAIAVYMWPRRHGYGATVTVTSKRPGWRVVKSRASTASDFWPGVANVSMITTFVLSARYSHPVDLNPTW